MQGVRDLGWRILINHILKLLISGIVGEKKSGDRKLQFSDRQLQISDSKISIKKYQKHSL